MVLTLAYLQLVLAFILAVPSRQRLHHHGPPLNHRQLLLDDEHYDDSAQNL